MWFPLILAFSLREKETPIPPAGRLLIRGAIQRRNSSNLSEPPYVGCYRLKKTKKPEKESSPAF
jgi:hypothetical protein